MCAVKCPLVVSHFIFIIDKSNGISITDRLSFISMTSMRNLIVPRRRDPVTRAVLESEYILAIIRIRRSQENRTIVILLISLILHDQI